MNIGIRWPPEGQEEPSEEATVRMLEGFCQEQCERLKSVGVRRITFMLITPVSFAFEGSFYSCNILFIIAI